MFHLSEKNPLPTRVVLVQALLRYKGFDVPITGEWDKKFADAIGRFRTQIGMNSEGPVDGQVFFNLLQDTKLKLIKSVDASAGDMAIAVKVSSERAGISPLMNPRIADKHIKNRGVRKAVELIRQRAEGHRIALLSIHGHGNIGTQISIALGNPHQAHDQGRMHDYNLMESDFDSYISEKHFERHRGVLSGLQPLFAPFGSVEVNSCYIAAKSPNLLAKLANTFGVPVTGGKDVQHNGNWDYKRNCVYRNKYGEQINATFELEGPLLTVYPNNSTLAKWAARVEKSLLNLPQMEKQLLKSVSNFVGM